MRAQETYIPTKKKLLDKKMKKIVNSTSFYSRFCYSVQNFQIFETQKSRKPETPKSRNTETQ